MNTISKRRAKSELKQKISGLRVDGFGKYTCVVYGSNGDEKFHVLKNLNEIEDFKTFHIDII